MGDASRATKWELVLLQLRRPSTVARRLLPVVWRPGGCYRPVGHRRWWWRRGHASYGSMRPGDGDCWDLDYTMIPSGGTWLFDRAKGFNGGVTHTSC